MTNICWDLAPEGAVAVGQRFGGLAFINAAGLAYIGDDWVVSSGWNIIGKRPQLDEAIRFEVGDKVKRVRGAHLGMNVGDCATVARVNSGRTVALDGYAGTHSQDKLELVQQQSRKTVEDAVAEHKGEWPLCHGISLMGYSPKHDQFFTFSDGYHCCDGEYKVCTREEFEACVAAKKYKSRLGCTVTWGQTNVPIAFIDKDGCEYELDDCSHGRAVYSKVKPTITKAAAWDYAVDSGLYAEEIEKNYTITD